MMVICLLTGEVELLRSAYSGAREEVKLNELEVLEALGIPGNLVWIWAW